MASKRRLRRAKERKENRECKNKIPYPNQTRAVSALISGRRKKVLDGLHHTYPCQLCGGWHIGTKMMTKKFLPHKGF